MTMTTESDITKKRGRPFGTFGPRRRQQQLIKHYVAALGGDGAITPIQEVNIARAVLLQSIAEQRRRHLDKHGSNAKELLALVRLENCAEAAVRRLKLPVTANTGVTT